MDQLIDGSTRLVDVWGPPGFGKTSVAIHVAHALRERKIPVYFTSLRGLKTRDDLVSNLLGIFEDAKEALHVSPSDRLIQCLRKWQSPFVLILDNADDLLESRDTQVRRDVLRLIEEFQAKCNHINLLVTSRESHIELSHKLPIHLERVGVLDEASSAELVNTLLSEVSESDCNCIMKECGRVPLAMRLMCGIIKDEIVSVSELFEELNNSPLIEILDNESYSDDCRLKKIMNTSFQRLTSNEQEAFVSLAVFPGCFGMDEAQAVLNLKPVLEARKILLSLKRKSLVDCSDDFGNFTIHSLLRSFVEDRRRKEEEIQRHYAEAQLRFCNYYISKFREANEKFLTGSSNDAYKAFHSQRENIRLALVDGSKDEDLYSKVVEVLSKAELFVYAVLPNQEALFDILYSTAIEEAKKRQRRDDECKLLAAKSFSSLGGFYSRPRSWDHSLESGDQNAENPPPKYLVYLGIHQLLSRNIDDGISSLRASVNRLGNDNDERILKILAYHVLAVCYRKEIDKEKVSEFETLCAKECELSSCCPAFLNLFLQNSHQLLEVEVCSENDLVNVIEKDVFFFVVMAELLPLLYIELEFEQHMVTELPLMTRHLKRFHKVILKLFDEGILHTRVVEACCNALYNSKCYQEAAEGFRRITDRLEVLGSTSRSAYRTYLFRGLALSELENYKEALHCFKETIAVKMELLNETQREGIYNITNVREALEQLANYLHMRRRLNETANADQTDDFKATFEKLKSIVQSELVNVENEDHDDLATCFMKLANCQVSMRNLAEALSSLQQAIAIREKHFDDQAKLALCLLYKGNVHLEMENYNEAIKAHQCALNLGSLDHQDTATIHCHLGMSYCALSDFIKSLNEHQRALELRKKHLGNHVLTATSLNEVGDVYFRMEKYDAAKEKFQSASDLMTVIYKREHVVTANALSNLGNVYFAKEKYKEAYDSCKQALNIRLKLLGEHEDTATSFHSLGSICFKMNDSIKAVWCFQKASELRQKLLGDHLDTALSYHCLGEAQMLKGDTIGPAASLQAAFRIRGNTLGLWNVDTVKTLELLRRAIEAVVHGGIGVALCDYILADIHFRSEYHTNLVLALKFCKEAVHTSMESLGENVLTADSLHLEGQIHKKMNDNQSAIEAFRKASRMKSNLRGDHENTADSFYCLGESHLDQGEYEAAVRAFQEAARIRSNIRGGGGGVELVESYRLAAFTYHRLGVAQYRLEDLRGALASLQEASRLRREALVEDQLTDEILQLINLVCEDLSVGELDCD